MLTTNKASTIQEKDWNQAVAQGSRFGAVLGGEITFGGSEVVVIMQKELTLEGENGLELVGMTAGNTRFGSKEMVSILMRPVR